MAEKEFYSSRKSTVITSIELQKDGRWLVSLKMIQNRKNEEDKDWEERETENILFGSDIDETVAQCALVFNQFLEGLNWDLFNLPKEEDKEKKEVIL